MESVEERLNRLREERMMRERARIEKLRELNLKKYSTDSNIPKYERIKVPNIKPVKRHPPVKDIKKNDVKTAKINCDNKLPPKTEKSPLPSTSSQTLKEKNKNELSKCLRKCPCPSKSSLLKETKSKFAQKNSQSKPAEKPIIARKSKIPPNIANKTNNLSVFERLYNLAKKPNKDPAHSQQVKPIRRSISDAHLKQIKKNELSTKRLHKCPSVGDTVNKAQDSDSENEMIVQQTVIEALNDFDTWRHNNIVSESPSYNDSNNTLTTNDTKDDIIKVTLINLAKLMSEGFDWKESARWLRAISERYPQASSYAAYWECRAVLEECRGAPFASLRYWEEAKTRAKGIETPISNCHCSCVTAVRRRGWFSSCKGSVSTFTPNNNLVMTP